MGVCKVISKPLRKAGKSGIKNMNVKVSIVKMLVHWLRQIFLPEGGTWLYKLKPSCFRWGFTWKFA